MSGLRTHLFVAVLLSALWVLPGAAHAGDVTVDYSQLEPHETADAVPLFSPVITTTDLSTLKAPIHLHPLTAAIASPTVKNLAAEVRKSEIHLHPPAPKALATVAPSAPVITPSAPVTNIDLSLAAVPAVKPVEATAQAEAPKTAEAAVSTDAPATVPETKTEVALDQAAVPAPKPVDQASDSMVASAATPMPTAPSAPAKPVDDEPPTFTRVNAVSSKMDDLTPQDVVGLDFGPPEKSTNN